MSDDTRRREQAARDDAYEWATGVGFAREDALVIADYVSSVAAEHAYARAIEDAVQAVSAFEQGLVTSMHTTCTQVLMAMRARGAGGDG